MIGDPMEMNQWKKDQLDYFRKYVKAFDANSKKYDLIMQGIKELEKSL